MSTNFRSANPAAADLDGTGLRIAVVCGRFNDYITNRLLEGVVIGLRELHVADEDVVEVWVPGAFEIPLAAKVLAQTGRYEAVIGLGAVIRGDTAHFDYVAGECAAGIQRAQLETGVPIAFGDAIRRAEQRGIDDEIGICPEDAFGATAPLAHLDYFDQAGFLQQPKVVVHLLPRDRELARDARRRARLRERFQHLAAHRTHQDGLGSRAHGREDRPSHVMSQDKFLVGDDRRSRRARPTEGFRDLERWVFAPGRGGNRPRPGRPALSGRPGRHRRLGAVPPCVRSRSRSRPAGSPTG